MSKHLSPQQLFITALQERDISYRRETIEHELSPATDSGRTNTDWVTEHVTPTTLLSKEEAALLDGLEKSGVFQNFLRQPGLTTTRPLSEDDLRSATATLKSSTEEIQRQTAILKSQYGLIQKNMTRENVVERDECQELAAANRRHLLDKQRTTAAADDLQTDIDLRIAAQKEQALVEKRQSILAVTSRLKDHDRTFTKAQILATDLESMEDDQKLKVRVTDLTSTLAKLVSEEVHCRLDRLYLETLQRGDVESTMAVSGDGSALILEEDLESLYSEVEILAEMWASQQFGQPISTELQRINAQRNHSVDDKLDLILHLISDMTLSTEKVTDQLLYRQSYCEALEALSTVYKKEITHKASDQPSTKSSHRRKSSLGFPASSQPTSSGPKLQLPALESFLRRLGISTPNDGSTERDSLAKLRSETRYRMVEFLRNLSFSADLPLVDHLGPTDRAKELLTSTLHVDSAFQLSLANSIQKERLADLEKQLGRVQKGIEAVNMDILTQRDKLREKFIERWS